MSSSPGVATTTNCGCLGRFVKLSNNAVGITTIYLRTSPPSWYPATTSLIPAQAQVMNLSQVGNTSVVSAGIAGLLAVGGNIAPGVAPTANPVSIGGVDQFGLTRRISTNNLGQIVPALNDVANADGLSQLDLLNAILLELRIANEQRHNFNFGDGARADEPSVYRNDPSAFALN